MYSSAASGIHRKNRKRENDKPAVACAIWMTSYDVYVLCTIYYIVHGIVRLAFALRDTTFPPILVPPPPPSSVHISVLFRTLNTMRQRRCDFL